MLPRLGFTEQCESKNIPESTRTRGKVVHVYMHFGKFDFPHQIGGGKEERQDSVVSVRKEERQKQSRESPPPPPFSHSLPPPFAIFLSLLVQTGGEREDGKRGRKLLSFHQRESVEGRGIDFPIPSSHLYVPT